MSKIQAVLFDNKIFKNTEECRYELKKMGLQPIKTVHITNKYYRYRISEPNLYSKLRVKDISYGIKFIIGFY